MGQTFAEKECSYGDFTVTLTWATGSSALTFTVTDTNNLLTTSKMIRAVLLDALDQFLAANTAQLITNGHQIGNGDNDLFGGSDTSNPGDGGKDVNFDFTDKTAVTPIVTTTSITASTTEYTAAKPYADVA